MPEMLSPIAARTVELVDRAVKAGIAEPAWLARVQDGTVSKQDVRAAKKLKSTYVYSGFAQGLSALMSFGRYSLPRQHDELIHELVSSIQAQAKEQGFWKTFLESIRDVGGGRMVVPR